MSKKSFNQLFISSLFILLTGSSLPNYTQSISDAELAAFGDPEESTNIEHSVIPITHDFELSVGKSSILSFKNPPVRVALSNPGIIYLLQISPNEWELIGRNPGVTNLYIWKDRENVMGTEITVGLAPPPHLKSTQTMEIVNGSTSELIYIGHPPEMINSKYGGIPVRSTGLVTDMPEPCLVPGCI